MKTIDTSCRPFKVTIAMLRVLESAPNEFERLIRYNLTAWNNTVQALKRRGLIELSNHCWRITGAGRSYINANTYYGGR